MHKIEEFLRFKDGAEWLLVDIPYLEFAAKHESVDSETVENAYERYKRENNMKDLSDYDGYDPTSGIILGAEIIVKVNGREFNPAL
jgi:hypothetical protein